jgi:hypothetical protein
MRNAYKILLENLKGRLRSGWEDNTIIQLRETGWEGENWIYVTQDRSQWWVLAGMIMNLWVP